VWARRRGGDPEAVLPEHPEHAEEMRAPLALAANVKHGMMGEDASTPS